ncbi:MAG TPA: endopeptidase La [Verrucomicrobiales bacterium]|nr:endopeptidase La [Verrucomicrobiales bacterium]
MKPNSSRAKETPVAPTTTVATLQGASPAPVRPRKKTVAADGLMPILPIRNAVLFPGMVVPLTIGRTASRKLVEELQGDTIGIFTQTNDTDEEPQAKDLHRVGVSAQVMRTIKQNADTVVIIVNVHERVALQSADPPAPYLKAKVQKLNSIDPLETPEWAAEIASLRQSALALLEHKEDVPDQVGVFIRNIDEPGRLTDFIAGGMEIELADRQALLEELDIEKRVRLLQVKVASQLHIAELQDKIQKDVQSQFGEMQKRAWLSEQKKAIEKELGEGTGNDGDELTKLRAKLAEADLPKEAREQTDRELKRLNHIPAGSPEYSVIISYLETIAAMPWSAVSVDNLDLKHARKVLDQDHFGLEKVKRRMIEYLAVRKLNPKGRSPIMLLLGPPGVGKTSLGQSVARALGRKFARVSLGGVRDEADIRGHRRTYIGAMPGRLVNEVRRAGTANPVILLDELDKLGNDFRGDPASALLEVLDPAQNHTFTDHYLDTPFDLSRVLFIGTANSLDTIPAALRDRLEVIELSSYTATEKKAIANKYLVPRQRKEHGLKVKQFSLSPEALDLLISDYTREAGVRDLERQVASLCRAVAAKIASGEKTDPVVSAAAVGEILGPPKFLHDEKLDTARPGVVTGLAWTPVGGEILHIEALRYPGKGAAQLTGQLGDVMKESVQTAMSLVRSRSHALGIAPRTFAQSDVHVHVPAGAVPKDGPSAGVAMFTALASLYTDKAVRADVAMTGEISLRGTVLPIGGLKEKSLAAMRAGISTILVPEANRKDAPDIPAEVKKNVKLIYVKTVDDVLREALVKNGSVSA